MIWEWLLLAVLVWVAWRTRRPRVRLRMKETEARAILGVSPDDGADAIRAAHRRLAMGVHPDKGGSVELSARVNAARDVLLGRSSRFRVKDRP